MASKKVEMLIPFTNKSKTKKGGMKMKELSLGCFMFDIICETFNLKLRREVWPEINLEVSSILSKPKVVRVI